MRFDGVRVVPWSPPEGTALPSLRINAVLGARDGSLWIGTVAGLARWHRGTLTNYDEWIGAVSAILEDRAGTIWIGRGFPYDAKGPLCQVSAAGVRCYGRDHGVALSHAVTLANDSAGNVWAGAGLMIARWQARSADTYVSGGLDPAEIFNGVDALAAGPDGSMWVGVLHAGKGGGLQRFARGVWKPFVAADVDGSTLEVTSLLTDRDGALWVGTLKRGVYRIYHDAVDHMSSADGLSSDAVTGFFQDREGNVWIATSSGIDNLHDLRVTSFTTRQGLSGDHVNAVLAARDGTMWIGNYGLDVLRSNGISSIQPGNGLPGRAVTSLLEDRAGRLWVGVDKELWLYEQGAFKKVRTRDGNVLGAVVAIAEDADGNIWARVSIETRTHRLVRIRGLSAHEELDSPQFTGAYTLASDPRGGLWLGLSSGGLARYRDGHVEFFSSDDGANSGPVYGLLVNADGEVLAATSSGLLERQKGKLQRLTVRNGLPCNTIYSLVFDRNATLWLYAACGLLAIPQTELQRWRESPDATVTFRMFDAFDGARPMSTPFQPNASRSPDGRLWFANQNVLQMIDPAHLDANSIPPPVHVEQIVADHKSYPPQEGLRLPVLTRSLEIDYTALSFRAPQKVRFRYMLEGRDSEWQDPGTRRQAFYADLRPANYRFRVTACNNDGVWNEEGVSLAFSVPAAWYQTSWFRGLSLAAFLAVLWALYQSRMQQVQRQERHLRDVIDTIPTMAFSTSSDGNNEWVNQRWVEYSGLSGEATSGSGWRATIHPDDLDQHVEKWQRALASGEPFENESRRRSATGDYRWFLVRAVPLRDAHGNIRKWYGTLTDIEDRKKAEQERERVRRLQSDLAHLNRVSMMGELAATLSHELQQPITAAITDANTCVRWLKRDVPDLDEAREAAMRTVRDGHRAAEIINRVRSFYRKGTPPERQAVDVNEVVREMLVLLRSEANRHHVTLRTDLDPDLPQVTADRVQLQQVCVNLIMNAIEAMKETAGEVTIKSELDQDSHVRISVTDTGEGLPLHQADQIFNAFFTTKSGGSGMGLTISRSIIESHGGRLWASANHGQGATVQFTLPNK